MKMDRRLTNGLAWAGALLVIGIPAADYLTGAFAGTPSVAVIDAAPVAAKTASVVPPAAPKPAVADAPKAAPTPAAKPQAVASASDPVSGFLNSGKALPSYITGGDSASTAAPAKPAATPVVQQPVRAVTTPVPATAAPAEVEQVAALPAKAAPMPMPLSMRPQPVSVPLASNQPLIIDQPATVPVVPTQQQPSDIITSEDLDDWESGPLNEFLARRGQQSSATYRVQQNNAPAYDSNGFWLDEGPRDQRYPQSNDDVYYTPF